MDGGGVRMELHHYTNQVPARRTRRQPINAANPTFNVQVGKSLCNVYSPNLSTRLLRYTESL